MGREAELLRTLKHDSIPFSIIPAVFLDNYPIQFNKVRSQLLSRQNLTLPEIGAALAHRNSYEKLLADNLECSLVLEDDARITNLQGLLEFCDFFHQSKKRTSYVLLFDFDFAVPRNNNNNTDDYMKVRSYPSSAVCYLVNARSAQLLSEANKNLDFLADFPASNEIDWYICTRSFVTHDYSVPSSIEMARKSARQNKFLRLITLMMQLSGISAVLLKVNFHISLTWFVKHIWLPKIQILRAQLNGNSALSSRSWQKNH